MHLIICDLVSLIKDIDIVSNYFEYGTGSGYVYELAQCRRV